jgi:transcription termination factor NusB
MQLEKIYINEAVRIRKTYMNNLVNIIEKEDEIEVYKKIMEDIKNEVENNESTNDEYFIKKLMELNDNIEKIKGIIMPHYETIKELDSAQRILYNRIKEKHPTITDEEIQNEIVPFIIPLDEDFRKKNINIYQKILTKQNN